MRLRDLILSITARLAKVLNTHSKFPSFNSKRVEVVFKNILFVQFQEYRSGSQLLLVILRKGTLGNATFLELTFPQN